MIKLWKNLKCMFGRHEYFVTRKVSSSIQELKCRNCGKEFGINHDLRCVIPLDEELRNVHDFMLGLKKINDIQ